MNTRVFLIRHGETEWSKSGRHTSRTDVPLTPTGEEGARQLAGRLKGESFGSVCTSPRLRARRTCELAIGRPGEVDPDLVEWDYGDYEGLTSPEIHSRRPEWSLFRDGCPNGESPAAVSARADRVIARLRAKGGDVILFTHGHFGRILAVRWIGLPVLEGRRFLLNTCSLSALGYEHDDPARPVISLWNAER